MTRRPSKHLAPPRPLLSAYPRAAFKADGRWIVQTMPGARAAKRYLCPGCNHPIAPGTPHLVVWPEAPTPGSERAVDDRRHWHTLCWERRP